MPRATHQLDKEVKRELSRTSPLGLQGKFRWFSYQQAAGRKLPEVCWPHVRGSVRVVGGNAQVAGEFALQPWLTLLAITLKRIKRMQIKSGKIER